MHYKLTEEIINLSESKLWESAKLEWNFEYAYQSEQAQTCLCGHSPISNICIIKNFKNLIETEVGNCCVNKFIGIDEGNKIFLSIKKIKNDRTKSISLEVIEYLKKKKIIDQIEFRFYIDILRKRNLSYKQLEFKKKINQKFVDFTSSEKNSHLTKINLVLKWSEKNTWFDKSFVNSLKISCSKRGKLTESQSIALENIIAKLNVK